jgi:15-cis-phytoene desaturase
MMNLFAELGIEDRLQWKVHKMVSARAPCVGGHGLSPGATSGRASVIAVCSHVSWRSAAVRVWQVFAMQELPGEFTTFDFIPGIPAPFNFGLAILLNQKMLSLPEKIQTAPPLLPMLVKGQEFIDAQAQP